MSKTLNPPPPPTDTPRVVYHVAAMGNWKEVVNHQLRLLRACGLHHHVRITYLGGELQWLKDRCIVHGVNATIVRAENNTDHYETLAMLEVERLAADTANERPILYFHTKGVSAPDCQQKKAWRTLMEEWVIRRWRENMIHLRDHDAVGVSWCEGGEQHFSGNFWIANPAWLRRLPIFLAYHIAKGQHRYSCEMWIGAQQWCKAYSLGCKNQILCWNDPNQWMPPALERARELPVTVCIPTIPPREEILRRALESVGNQTCRVGMSVHVDRERKGAAHARNAALAGVKTEWVAFLDDDDELYPDHCQLLYDHAIATGTDLVYAGCVVLDPNETPIPLREDWGNFGKEFDPEMLRKKSCIPVTCLARTELAKKVGFKCPPGSIHEDWGFYLGMLEAGAKIVHLPVVTWKWNHWGYGTPGTPGNTSGQADRW